MIDFVEHGLIPDDQLLRILLPLLELVVAVLLNVLKQTIYCCQLLFFYRCTSDLQGLLVHFLLLLHFLQLEFLDFLLDGLRFFVLLKFHQCSKLDKHYFYLASSSITLLENLTFDASSSLFLVSNYRSSV